MSFGWGNLAANQMVSFTDAQGGGYSLDASQSHVTSEQCMTKAETIAKYNVDDASFNTYAANQLVPKGPWQVATVYQSAAYSESITKNSCAVGGTGSSVTLSAYLGQFTSTTSQAAANQLAIDWVQANKQTNANTNGTCIWYNVSTSGTYSRTNCGADYTGSSVTYTIVANAYSSNISQADANTKAQNDVNANGQTYANSNGTCTISAWYNAAQSGTYTRTNCGGDYIGGSVTYTVAAGTYRSTVSQTDANNLAIANVSANGQVYANANGTCTIAAWYNIAKAGTFTRTNCGGDYAGGSATYTVAAGAYRSTTSQAHADAVAQSHVDAYGQNAVNGIAGGLGTAPAGSCTLAAWYNISTSGTFTRTNCGTPYNGGSATYTVAAGAYRSTVSQAHANSLAQNDVNTYGQTRVNGGTGGLGSASAGSCVARATAWRGYGGYTCETNSG